MVSVHGAPGTLERNAARIFDALSVIVRRVNLPRVHERVVMDAGVHVDRAGFVVLSRLGDGPGLRLSELAERLGTDLSTVSRQVAALHEAGLVARTRDPRDRRAACIVATPDGREVRDRLLQAWRAAIRRGLASWPEEDLGRFADLLERFAAEALPPP